MAIEALTAAPSWFLVILVVILLYFVIDSRKEKQDQEKARNQAIQSNTMALIHLKSSIEALENRLIDQHVRITNLEDDVDALHKAKREKGDV